MTSSMTHRILAAATSALLVLLLAGCREATIETPTPEPSPAASSPSAESGSRYGNNPVAAADGLRLEQRLRAGGEYWEVSLSTEPASAGQLDHPDAAALAAARAAARQVHLVIATEVRGTIEALLAGGRAGQQQYCLRLLDQVRALGYTGLQRATVDVYFSEQDRHAELTWSASGPSTYTVFDNDLGGVPSLEPGESTPFPAPPSP
jgi:hypothetical protein